MFLTISDFSYHIAILMIIKNNDKTTKLALIVLLLVVFFDSGASKGVSLSPYFGRGVSVAFIIVIMTEINCCSNKYDHPLHVFQIKRARIQREFRMRDNHLLKQFAHFKGI